jgi:hypothetical protein
VRDISKLTPKFFFGYRQPGAQLHRRADVVRKTLISASLSLSLLDNVQASRMAYVPERTGLLFIPSAAVA